MAGPDQGVADPFRAFIKSTRRVVIKVGTAVVTRPDGRLSLGRLGSLCEQVEDLLSDGIEVILVSSGAVGVGRQKLRYQKMIHSTLKELHQMKKHEPDTKACAAIGQSGLMALYDALFGQLDVACSQLLVTDSDFGHEDFRDRLRETVTALVSNKIVPVFNENDAISTRKAPYNDESGIFWDNDSLAALLARELGADLLVLLSDVDGLYTGPPSDKSSELIHTYIRELHHEQVTFGEKSRVGRGGMTAKIDAAWLSAKSGVPVVIANGGVADVVSKVMNGDHIGTLIHRDAAKWDHSHTKGSDIGKSRDAAVAARTASRKLQALTSAERSQILLDVADALVKNEELILKENGLDVQQAQASDTPNALLQRLKLKPGKIAQLAAGIRSIAAMDEPVSQLQKKMELAEGLVLEKRTASLGVLLVIFESRPDALPQIASLAIRSGNGLLLKGGKEAARSNAILHKIITEALPPSVGPHLIGLVTSREGIADLLKLDDVIDLVIPRGGNALVTHIKENTKIAVLGHADGVCHVYVDKAADVDMAKKVVVDAKIDYPAACNAMETLLVHEDLAKGKEFNQILDALKIAGVTLKGGKRAAALLNLDESKDFHVEYGDDTCTVEIVRDIQEAIDHIHAHGSSHTEAIITEDQKAADLFLRSVDSACVHLNASTRFSDGFRYGLGAEVGISTSRIHARGPVGVEGLLTSRWLLRGKGHVVAKDKDIKYTHKSLPLVGDASGERSANGMTTANGVA
ncbi:delta 1-pyrroline-5-carboxylate synthetase [Klebsormidium nitens]|uniref:Delta-1-pyrroline-5-carboxylate synthase n=1 Tax=Klebsormidium nitens TaxID=105231 RepID=A0A1Y1IMW6_KLENI|nr:delta 1-pyrroline-5-carboxylate synthetase [Klebsormidium nitens]|eukprot:GAQ89957.1 delta 1-pyrroline-5-carboxylate synthetase [Klebsormidium nitens]